MRPRPRGDGLAAPLAGEAAAPTISGIAAALFTSIRARAAAHRLDLELAGGADPDSNPLRRRRALQLTRGSARRSLARSLERAVKRAQEPRGAPLFGGVPLQRTRVQRCERALLELAKRLRDDRPVDVQGVAMTSVLLSDGRSPLYYPHASYSLLFLARRATFALDPLDLDSLTPPADLPHHPAQSPRA